MASFSWTRLYSCYSSETLTAVACSEGLQGRPRNTKTAKSWIPPMNGQKAQSHRMIVEQLIMAQCTNWRSVGSKYSDRSSRGVHGNRSVQFSSQASSEINVSRTQKIHLWLKAWVNLFLSLISCCILSSLLVANQDKGLNEVNRILLWNVLWDSDDVIEVIPFWAWNFKDPNDIYCT